MQKCLIILAAASMMTALSTGCASSNDRRPSSYSRSGRDYEEPKAMNHRRLDTNTLYNACLRERSELSCRNRLGR